jgi:hypothetical protein
VARRTILRRRAMKLKPARKIELARVCAVRAYSKLKRFDLLLGSSVLAVLLLVALIGAFMWLEL